MGKSSTEVDVQAFVLANNTGSSAKSIEHTGVWEVRVTNLRKLGSQTYVERQPQHWKKQEGEKRLTLG